MDFGAEDLKELIETLSMAYDALDDNRRLQDVVSNLRRENDELHALVQRGCPRCRVPVGSR